MSAAMDLRISADSDIKRLREMVQKLEEKNAGLKIGETTSSSSKPGLPELSTGKDSEMMNVDPSKRVAVKLNLEDVPLMDLNESDSEEEDSWLYMSPVCKPSPAQKSVSPYKYLQHCIDGSNLNKVRGSLMAKLESIASQEGAIARHDHPPSPPRSRSSSSHMDENATRPRLNDYEGGIEAINTGTFVIQRKGSPRRSSPRQHPGTQYQAWGNLAAANDDDNNDVVRRRGQAPLRVPSTEFEDDIDDDDMGPVNPRESEHIDFGLAKPRSKSNVRPRGTPSSDDMGAVRPRSSPAQGDMGPIRPRGSPAQNYYSMIQDDDDEIDGAPIRRREGGSTPTSRSIARMPDDEISVVNQVRPRGRPSPNFAVNVLNDDQVSGQIRPRGSATQSFAVNIPDDDVDEIMDAPVRRRTPKQSMPASRANPGGSPQMAWQDEDEDTESFQVRARRRAPPPQSNSFKDEEDDIGFDNQAPVVRRRGPPTNKPSDDSLVATAVRRRQVSPQDGQVRPRGAGMPSPQYGGGLPTPTKRGTPSKLRASEDIEIRRRSLPQVPSTRTSLPPSSYSDHQITPRGSSGPKGSPKVRVRSASPAGRLGQRNDPPVVPRGSKLAAPRRIPAPNNSYYNDIENNWQDGCY